MPTDAESRLSDVIDNELIPAFEVLLAHGYAARLPVPLQPPNELPDPNHPAAAFFRAALSGPGREADALRRCHEAMVREGESLAKARDIGKKVAEALVSSGGDASPLLRFLRCWEFAGGGVIAAGRYWPRLKAELQQVAIELRQRDDNSTNAARGEQAGGRKSKPKSGGRRGAPVQYDHTQDKELLMDWQAAKEAGTRTLADFARVRGMNETDVRRALDRAKPSRRGRYLAGQGEPPRE